MRNILAPNGASIEIVAHRGSLFRLDADMRLTAFETDALDRLRNGLCAAAYVQSMQT